MSGYEPARPVVRRAILTALAGVSTTFVAVVGCPSGGPSMASSTHGHGRAATANLDPELLGALRQAAADAAADSVEIVVNSGWRSREQQEHLLRKAVRRYGSEEEAARWVATPGTSPHVSGEAVDIGHSDATAWLSRHGAAYGLCQIYGNEPWHYELRPEAVDDGCPSMFPDPTYDPRMQQ